MAVKEGTAKRLWKNSLALVVLIAALLILGPSMLLAQNDEEYYVEIGSTNSGTTYSLYVPSVERRSHYSGDYLVGWVRCIYSEQDAENLEKEFDLKTRPDHEMVLYAANENVRQIQVLSGTYYDREGNVIDSYSVPFLTVRWEECIPGSIGEGIWEDITYFGEE